MRSCTAETLADNHLLRGVVQELLARRRGEELRVTPFSEAAIADYLCSRFAAGAAGRPALQELAPLLHRRTGGNPLFVVSVVEDLLRQGAVCEEAGAWRLYGDPELITESVPDTLRRVIGVGRSLMVRGIAVGPDHDPGPTEERLAGYGTFDAGATWRFTQMFDGRLVVRNILDHDCQQTADTKAVLAPGRTILMTVAATF